MNSYILLCDPDIKTDEQVKDSFLRHNFNAVITKSGEAAQIAAHENNFQVALLDINTKNSSSFELLSYIKKYCASTKVFFTYKDEQLLNEIGLTAENAANIGIYKLLKKPYTAETILESLEQIQSSCKNKLNLDTQDKPSVQDSTLQDSDVSSLPIFEFYAGNVSAFDLFIKIKENCYVKILHKGDFFSPKYAEELKTKKNINFLYFKNKDRQLFLDLINSYLKKYLTHTNPEFKKIHSMTQSLIENYIEEINTKGLNPKLLKQGEDLTQNVCKTLSRNNEIEKYLKELEEISPKSLSHLYLTTIFSSIIASNIPWATGLSRSFVIKGALLHDIGLTKLPMEARAKNVADLNSFEKAIYLMHPEEGYKMLSNYGLPQQVRQIVYQHHEMINGEGFPNRLSGIRIFPLAKIVSFASDFSYFIIENALSPLQGLNAFVPNRELITRYDAACVKAFFSGFKQ